MPRRENDDEYVDEDWVDDGDQDEYDIENEEERKFAYGNMCSDDDDDENREPISYLNDRYKKRIVKNVVVNLPTMSSEVKQETQYAHDGSVKLNLPSGGWAVKKVEAVPIYAGTPSLSDSKLKAPTKKKFSSSREGGWKKMTDFFSPFEEQSPPVSALAEEEFVKVVKKSRERTAKLPVIAEEKPQFEAPRNLKCTKMCNSGKDCKRPGCNYAHSMDEFNPIECKFQTRCKNPQSCTFKHSFESKDNFLARIRTIQRS